MGTLGPNGQIWSPADPNNLNADFRAGLNDQQSDILHYQRNYYQRDLPKNISEINWDEWEDLGEAVAHNIATSGNRDLRGRGARAGQQLILDHNGNRVDDPINMGTFDFSPPSTDLLAHVHADVRPWLEGGNSPKDTSTYAQRVAAMSETRWGKAALVYISYLRSRGK